MAPVIVYDVNKFSCHLKLAIKWSSNLQSRLMENNAIWYLMLMSQRQEKLQVSVKCSTSAWKLDKTLKSWSLNPPTHTKMLVSIRLRSQKHHQQDLYSLEFSDRCTTFDELHNCSVLKGRLIKRLWFWPGFVHCKENFLFNSYLIMILSEKINLTVV